MESHYWEHIKQSAEYIRSRIDGMRPATGLVLGSGLGDLAEQVEEAVYLDYVEIPHFPLPTVEGHAGRLAIGKLEEHPVIVMQGRFHYYEGYSMKQVVFPVYIMKELGVETLILTNAAGGMNRAFEPGNLMLIKDHINFTGSNPLIGPNDEAVGPRFPDLSEAYSRRLRDLIRDAAEELDGTTFQLTLQEGVYCGISGPSYMTPSELTMLANLGGDAVGMSTVAEAIAARHCGLELAGISCITDMAIGEELEALSHEQVVEVANRTKPAFAELIRRVLRRMS
ncbi:purine-nucleoside phosphorylase [Paenibacillus senegalensis]|uniref:purine-nucleoside phosphorylase n=1 Tax=Paenibacillus senegalensis TaxID=1465766 RepID=UPI00028A1FFB|nr:purine-nucleoside phosphorylase [Paenibacillus senegalensis]